MSGIENLKWSKTDEIPPKHFILKKAKYYNKLKEFIEGPHDIAFLQAKDKSEVKNFANNLRKARKTLGLTGDDIRIVQNYDQLRVYVAKRLVKESIT